jgi:CheY-like chemotaxis protein
MFSGVEEAWPPRRPRVLVVDDEPGVRTSLRWQLQAAGYDVLEAVDGGRVVETVKREGVDLVVTDLIMPNHEGVETIQALQKECPDVPIIAMSASSDNNLAAAQAFGARRTFAKPFEWEEFLAAVSELLASAPTAA